MAVIERPHKEQPIIVVPSSVHGKGVCVECGNGLWPDQPPCEHKRANAPRRGSPMPEQPHNVPSHRLDFTRGTVEPITDDDPITRADLTRELHYMESQVEQHGFPGTRAVLAELERLHAENAKLREALVIARESIHDLCLERGSTDQYRQVFDGINAALNTR